MRPRAVGLMFALVAATTRLAAQDDGGEKPPRIEPDGVKIDVEKPDERIPHSEEAGPGAPRIDPERLRTNVDQDWSSYRTPEALEARMNALSASGDAARRAEAISIAASGADGLRFLVSCLGHGNLQVEDAATYALVGAGPAAIPVVSSALSHPHFRVRARAARVLERLGPAASSEAGPILDALLDENSYVRECAVDAVLAVAGPTPDVVQALSESLGDPDSFVRQRAARALGRIGPGATSAVERLAVSLDLERDGDSRIEAARALCRIGQPADAVARSLGMALGSDPRVSAEVDALLRTHIQEHEDAMPAIFPLVDPTPRGRAVRDFLHRQNGVDQPTAQAWTAWFERNR